MITRDELGLYLHTLLSCDVFQDYAPNGLQVEGRDHISRICTAVTASQAVITQASLYHADALLVHHGYFWRGENQIITGMKQRRIKALLTEDMNLFGYHLPLDCHPTLGNNACLAGMLDVVDIKRHQIGQVPNLLWSGTLKTPMTVAALTTLLTRQLHRMPLHVGPNQLASLQRIAWCTGGAEDYIENAYHLGVDAYLSGEISERTYYQSHELGIHYFACGHHATERGGIHALGLHLAEQFGLEHLFIDSDNPV